jgi:hypothetical protein
MPRKLYILFFLLVMVCNYLYMSLLVPELSLLFVLLSDGLFFYGLEWHDSLHEPHNISFLNYSRLLIFTPNTLGFKTNLSIPTSDAINSIL